jgi:hypothetical protein
MPDGSFLIIRRMSRALREITTSLKDERISKFHPKILPLRNHKKKKGSKEKLTKSPGAQLARVLSSNGGETELPSPAPYKTTATILAFKYGGIKDTAVETTDPP